MKWLDALRMRLAEHAATLIILTVMAALAWGGYTLMMHRIEARDRAVYSALQEQATRFEKLADGIAQAQVKVVEKHHYKRDVVHELPPEIRERLRKLDAKVEAVAEAVLTIPEQHTTGQGTATAPAQWEYATKHNRIRFRLERLPPGALPMLELATGVFDVTEYQRSLKVQFVQGITTRAGVDGIQHWFAEAHEVGEDGPPLAVESLEVRIPNLYERKRWWQTGTFKFAAGAGTGAAAVWLLL